MRTVLVCLLLVLSTVLPASANGQAGEIVLYVDPNENGSQLCWFNEWNFSELRFVTVYVVHRWTTGATGSRFRLERSSGLYWSYWWMTSNYTVSGSAEGSGVTVEYGTCVEGNAVVAEVLYEILVTSMDCSFLTPVAHADAESGEIEVTLCDESVVAGGGRPLTVNRDTHCPYPWCLAVPVQPTTWGRIKALYGE